MHAMTAAHKDPAARVFVKVRNKENGRETIVRVNDRGPSSRTHHRPLLLCGEEAWRDVKGTAPVRIEALGYKAGGKATRRRRL